MLNYIIIRYENAYRCVIIYNNDNKWTLISDDKKQISLYNNKLRMKGISEAFTYYTDIEFDIDLFKDFKVCVSDPAQHQCTASGSGPS